MRKKNLRTWASLVIAAMVSFAATPMASAQEGVPMLINYEGELRLPATGDPVPDGTYSMRFQIYDVETGGTHLWEEHHSAAHGNPVQVRRGVFSVLLGSGMGDVLNASVFSGSDRWLEVSIETETMSPRQRITSTAYSIVSEDSHLLNGNAASAFAETVHSHSGTDVVSGTVPEGRIDATIARDTEVDTKITSHADIADAHHVKTTTFSELTGTLSEAQIPPAIARDSEVSGEIAAHEAVVDAHHARYADSEAVAAMGAKADINPLNHDKTASFSELTGTLSEAQIPPMIARDSEVSNEIAVHEAVVDAHHTRYADTEAVAAMGAKADSNPLNHDKTASFSELTGTLSEAQIPPAIARDSEIMPTVLGNDGPGSTLNADVLDGVDSTGFAAVGHTHAGEFWGLQGNGGTSPGTDFVGTRDSQAVELRVNNTRALRLEPASTPNLIGGYAANAAVEGVVGAAIGGGGEAGFANRVTDDFGTVAGGRGNQAGDGAGTTSDSSWATVGGGAGNLADGTFAAVGAGQQNTATGDWATVGGGYQNSAVDDYSTVGGGAMNSAEGDYSTIAGGGPSDPAILATRNRVTDSYGTVGGGGNNQAGDDAGITADAPYATVGGGRGNTASGRYSTVGGGHMNTASGGDLYYAATVAGGYQNAASADCATVGGGRQNTASDWDATVAGGEFNTASANNAAVGGGDENTASSVSTTIGGGSGNVASGYFATVGGGYHNTAGGSGATVPGGNGNSAAGTNGFAAGHRAHAAKKGSFVWGDSQDADISATEEDQVTFRCLGGVRFLSGSTGTDQTVSWAPGDSSWSFTSDLDLKENFVEVDARDVLDKVSALPIAEWNFKSYTQRHIGPMAQDFHALFPLGGSDTRIDSGDLQGVSLAAIQGLHELLNEKDEKISTLEARVEALETLVEKLVESQAGGE